MLPQCGSSLNTDFSPGLPKLQFHITYMPFLQQLKQQQKLYSSFLKNKSEKMLCVMLILALRPNRQRKIRAESAVCGWLDRCAGPFESLCSMSLASSSDTSSALALTYVPPPMKCPMGRQWIIGWQVAKSHPTTETESWHKQIPFCAVLRWFFLHTLGEQYLLLSSEKSFPHLAFMKFLSSWQWK